MNNTLLTGIIWLIGPVTAFALSVTATPSLQSIDTATYQDNVIATPYSEDTPKTNPIPTQTATIDTSDWVRLSYWQRFKIDFNLRDCRVTQTEDQHHQPWHWSMYAMDIACIKWQSFKVFTPNWKDVQEYTVVHKGFTPALWTYITLGFVRDNTLYAIVYGHTLSTLKIWDKAKPWAWIWDTTKNWISTAVHAHIELWKWYTNLKFDFTTENPNSSKIVSQRERLKENQWSWSTFTKNTVFYFTHYDFVAWQTDGNPCWWAAWVDMCELEKQWVKTMALTKDIRQLHWIKRWDMVKLSWEPWCAWTYKVLDEMNPRFRWQPAWYKSKGKRVRHPTGNTKRPWTNYFIKWDLPNKPGGACKVIKL